MFEKLWGFEESPHFLTTHNYREFLFVFDLWQLNPFIFHSQHTIRKPKAVDRELEVRVGRGIVFHLNQIQIIVDLIRIYVGGNLIKMKGQFGKVAAITTKSALALSGNHNFLMKFFVKWLKPFYLRTCLFNQIFLFFS